MKKVLIVDDDEDIVLMLRDRLEQFGYESVTAEDGKQAMDLIEQESPDMVLLDLEMPRMSGFEVLEYVTEQNTDTAGSEHPMDKAGGQGVALPIIVMTAHVTVSNAVKAMKAGAYDFLTKPIDYDQLSIVLKKALEREGLRRQVTALRTEIESRYSTIVGNSVGIQGIVQQAKRAAKTKATILLLGESGTGKELFARSIHQWSNRSQMPFSIINCVALNETLLENELFGHEKGSFTGADSRQKGRIEEADGGTVFLDEIGDMPLPLQAKLLRLLQDHAFHRVGGGKLVKVNIRVLAATNKDLRQAVKDGTFREDLYFRLDVVSLSLPSLRERPTDILPLAEYLLRVHQRELNSPASRFTNEAIKAMKTYGWPGNIRQLSNAIERAVVLATTNDITPEELALPKEEVDPLHPGDNLPYHEAMEECSRYILQQALRRSQGSSTKAAELLHLQRTYLSKLIKKKHIQCETI